MKENRRTIRYPFQATAELIEEQTQRQLSVHVAELSLYGCYFDMVNPFPVGAIVLVKIVKDLVFFEASARVLYSNDGRGMGVAFEKVHPHFLKVLQTWLMDAERTRLRTSHQSIGVE